MLSNIKKLFYKLILILSLLLTFKVSLPSDENLIKSLSNTGNHKTFIRILENSPLFLSLVNNTVSSTIYAPTDKAFSLMPDSFMREINNNNIKYSTKIILTHIFSGNSLEINKDEGLVLSLDGSLYYTYDTKEDNYFIIADSDLKLKQIKEILSNHMVRQNINTKSISFEREEKASGNKVKQDISIHDGINKDIAQDIVKKLKSQKLKIQSAIQGDQIRVSGKKRDDLQEAITFLKSLDLSIPISFINFRD